MNDPDRRQTSDGFDHDAMFADIVAHWNEAAAKPAAGQPQGEDETAGDESLRVDQQPVDQQPVDQPRVDKAPVDRVRDDQVRDDQVRDDQVRDDRGRDRWVPDEAADAGAFDAGATGDRSPMAPSPSSPEAIPAPQAWRAHDVDDDYEEHFEPPPVAPLPVGDLQFWGIIAGMGGGPLLLLYLVLFNREASSYWMLTAIAMSVGGFAMLVARLPRDHEDDSDNGARL